MSTKIASMYAEIRGDSSGLTKSLSGARAQMQGFGKSSAAGMGKATAAGKQLSAGMGMLHKAAAGLVALQLGKVFLNVAKESAVLAARVETLQTVVYTLGKNANYGEESLDGFEKGIKSMGITTQAARQSMAMMMQSQIDLAHGTDLARLAQDAAVVANLNSSQAFEKLVYTIQTGNIRMARNMGLVVDFQGAYTRYAKSVDRSSQSLTEQEKVQIRVNEVLRKGAQITGAYESAMETAGKKMSSYPRYLEELKLAFGTLFQPALGAAIDGLTKLTKNVTDGINIINTWAGLIDGPVNEAITAHINTLKKAGVSYSKYEEEVMRVMVASGKLAKSDIEYIKTARKMADELQTLEAHYGKLTELNLNNLWATGQLTDAQISNIRVMQQQVIIGGQLEETLGLHNEQVWNLISSKEELLRVDQENEHMLMLQAAAYGANTDELAEYEERIKSAAEASASATEKTFDMLNRDLGSPMAAFIKDMEWMASTGGVFEKAFGDIQAALVANKITPEQAAQMTEELIPAFYAAKQEVEGLGINQVTNQMAADTETSWYDAKEAIIGAGGFTEALDTATGATEALTPLMEAAHGNLTKVIDDLKLLSEDDWTIDAIVNMVAFWTGSMGGSGGTGVKADSRPNRGERYAAGGRPGPGVSLVGEHGPELIINGVVIPAQESKKLKRLGLGIDHAFSLGGHMGDQYSSPTTASTTTSTSSTIPGWWQQFKDEGGVWGQDTNYHNPGDVAANRATPAPATVAAAVAAQEAVETTTVTAEAALETSRQISQQATRQIEELQNRMMSQLTTNNKHLIEQMRTLIDLTRQQPTTPDMEGAFEVALQKAAM